MKAFSIRQPWASMIARGEKTIETRTWATHYRGSLLICSGVARAKGLARTNDPIGVALCIVDVVGCRPMVESDESAACCRIYPGAWAWILDNVRPVTPFPVSGKLKFFEVPDELLNERSNRIREPRPVV